MNKTSNKLFGFGLMCLAALAFGCSAQAGDAQADAVEDGIGQTASALGISGAYHDFGTQKQYGGVWMHGCPDGYAMQGAHVGDNVFRCVRVQGLGTPYLDTGTQRTGSLGVTMHACPYGSVMVGLHEGYNYLACASAPVTWEVEQDGSESGTQDDYPMHTCWANFAMTGIHIGMNHFICGS